MKKVYNILFSILIIFTFGACSSNQKGIYLSYAAFSHDSYYGDSYALYFNYIYTDNKTIPVAKIDAKVNGDSCHILINGEEPKMLMLTPNSSITVYTPLHQSELNSIKSVSIEIFYKENNSDKNEMTIANKTFSIKSLKKKIKKFV